MIDEELYQRAADELNSDRRDPKLWAKACALASDDHDEARFLYTNLRVEQLLDKTKRQRSAAPSHDTFEAAIDAIDSPADSRKEQPAPEDRVELDPAAAPTIDDMPAPVSVRTPTSLELEPESDFDLEPIKEPDSLDSTIVEPFDVETTQRPEKQADFLAEANSDSPSAAPPEFLAEHTVGQDSPLTADGLTAEPEHVEPEQALGGRPGQNQAADEFSWLEDPVVSTDTDNAIDSQALTAATAIEREPIDAIVEGSHAATQTATQTTAARSYADAQRLAKDTDSLLDDHSDRTKSPASAIRDDYADAHTLDDLLDQETQATDSQEITKSLKDGRGPKWIIYESHIGSLKAIKRGVSWGALWLTMPWLVVRGLIGTAISYGLVWIACLSGVVITGLAWIDAGPEASLELKATCAAFAFIAVIALVIVPFVRGNRWRERRLIRKGYTKLAKVRARSADEAIGRWRRAMP